MLPEFNQYGYLPPGIHPARLDEIEARFGRQWELRRVQMQSLGWLMDIARRAGVARIIINEYLVKRFFATDRDSVPKGMVEVII